MPTYDYACKGCGHRFERFESIHDGAVKPCPKCGKKRARRMLGTGAGLIFKGSGFYSTDYKGAGRGTKEGGSSKEGSSSKEGAPSKEGASSKEGDSKKPVKEKKEEKEHKK